MRWERRKGNIDPTYLTHAARKNLREKFLHADVAMTGANFAVASTGEIVVCTNEGNADMGTSFPKVHIATMGMEKIVPNLEALGRIHSFAGSFGYGATHHVLYFPLSPSVRGTRVPYHYRG